MKNRRILNYREFISSLRKAKQVEPVYIFTGEEVYLKKECIKIIKNKIFTPEDIIDFNYQIMYVSEVDLKTILNACRVLPLGASKRLIVAKDFHKIKLSKQDEKELNNYLNMPVEHTCLILLLDKEVKDKDSEIKKYNNIATIIKFNTLSQVEVHKWVEEYVQDKYQKNIQHTAIRLLVDKLGTSLTLLASEIEKLYLYTYDKNTIEEGDIFEVTGESKEENIFSLLNAIGYKKTGEALKILNKLLEYGETPVVIFFMITRHFRTFFKIKLMQKEGIPLSVLWEQLGLKRYKSIQTSLVNQANLYTIQALNTAFELLLETDTIIKTHSKDFAHIAMEMLVFKLCSLTGNKQFKYLTT
jgi:DNA polymerase-3 subunit delta